MARRLLAESVALVFADARAERRDFGGLPELAVEGLGDGDARALLALGDPGSAGRAGARPDRRRDARQPAGAAGAAARADAGGAGGRVRACRTRCRCRAGSRRASGGGSTRCRPRPSGCCWSRRPSRSATRRWCGARPSGSGSGPTRRRRRRRRACSSSARGCGSAIRWCARRSTGRRRRSERQSVAPRAGRGHRSRGRSRSPRLAPRAGGAGPDEDVAAELERSAGRAQARGGPGGGGRLPRARGRADARAGAPRAARAGRGAGQAPGRRARRGARAAGHGARPGRSTSSSAPGWSCCARRSRSPSSRGSDAPPLLLEAAKRLEPLDAELARETYLDAFAAAIFAGRLARGGDVLRGRRRRRSRRRRPRAARRAPADLLLDGLALLITEGYAAARADAEAGAAARSAARSISDGARSSAGSGSPATSPRDLWDDESLGRALHPPGPARPRCRRAHACCPSPSATRIGVHAVRRRARRRPRRWSRRRRRSPRRPGATLAPYGALAARRLAGPRSRGRRADRGHHQGRDAPRRGTRADRRSSGRARCSTTASAATTTRWPRPSGPAEHPHELGCSTWALAELIEAAARSGKRRARGRRRSSGSSETTRASGTDWALGIEARSRALLSEGEAAERLYREAIERLGRTRIRVGARPRPPALRRMAAPRAPPLDAREQLRTAHEHVHRDGHARRSPSAPRASCWPPARRARKRTVETARRAHRRRRRRSRGSPRDGLSNPEIGAQLFISPRTVEYHLRKVFGKLDISSRTQLAPRARRRRRRS